MRFHINFEFIVFQSIFSHKQFIFICLVDSILYHLIFVCLITSFTKSSRLLLDCFFVIIILSVYHEDESLLYIFKISFFSRLYHNQLNFVSDTKVFSVKKYQ